ncbi:MAG: CotH kinase family protein [Verrucomicrobiales bacterium]|nr:CotH kinase family protein [Verrucomicrobiales bacterium]
MRLAGAAPDSVAVAREETPGSVFSIPLLPLDIRMKDGAWRALSLQTMESPKLYAEATVQTESGTWPSVGIKLKGSYGSFQSAEERPGLTLHLDKFKGARRFAGLTRLHLNNGSQDDSRLHEWLGGELARAAGVPAGRAGHAWLTLQGRDRGLYVIRESFTPEFLSEWFGPPGKGDLYDAATGGDLQVGMEKDQGEEGENTALQTLIDALNLPETATRQTALEGIGDLSEWRSVFVAEVLLGHWDGYALAANNYRLYQRPSDGRFVFILHGMDQILGDPDAPVYPEFPGLAARALLELPGEAERYAAEVRRQANSVWKSTDWTARIRSRAEALATAVARHDETQAVGLRQSAADVVDRFERRRLRVLQAAEHPPERVLLGPGGRIALREGWYRGEEPGAEFLPPDQNNAHPGWRLRATEFTEASWRQTLWLPRGRYRLSAVIRATEVVTEHSGDRRGAGLRVLGHEGRYSSWIAGTRGPRRRHLDFEADGPVTLLLELVARTGEARFDSESLTLERR